MTGQINDPPMTPPNTDESSTAPSESAVRSPSPETDFKNELAKAADDINSAVKKADRSQAKADDLLIAALKMLADAERKCKAAGLSFKPWVDENIEDWSYKYVMELIPVGRSKNPQQTLADLRAKWAERKLLWQSTIMDRQRIPSRYLYPE